MAEEIGPRLARAALAVRVDGEVWDLDRPIPGDARFEVLTEKQDGSLDVLRHSAAHVLATAVRELFPDAQIGFGPPIEDGFYYDFDVGRPFTPEDLEAIETRMKAVAKADHSFVREEVDRGVGLLTVSAEEAKRIMGEQIPSDTDSAKRDKIILGMRFPIGLVAVAAKSS